MSVIAEHMKTLNGRVTKVEGNVEGISGTQIEHDETIHELCYWKESMKEAKMKADARMIGFFTLLFTAISIIVRIIWN